MAHDPEPGAHPRVHVAGDGDHHLRFRELALDLHPGERHPEVEPVGARADRVHVVERLVGVAEGDRLPGADAGDPGDELAAPLVDHHRVARDRIVPVGNAPLHPDERLGHASSRRHEHRDGAGRRLPAAGERPPRDSRRRRRCPA